MSHELENENPVDLSEFDMLLEKRKGLLDGIHDCLRSLIEEQKHEPNISELDSKGNQTFLKYCNFVFERIHMVA